MGPVIAIVGELLGKVLGSVLPDPAQRAAAQAQAFELLANGTFTEKAEQQLALAQIDVNKAEAESPSVFKGGWRPAAGWMCVIGLAMQLTIVPVLGWAVEAATGHKLPPLPPMDSTVLMGLLVPLLGLGGYRTAEKIKGAT